MWINHDNNIDIEAESLSQNAVIGWLVIKKWEGSICSCLFNIIWSVWDFEMWLLLGNHNDKAQKLEI